MEQADVVSHEAVEFIQGGKTYDGTLYAAGDAHHVIFLPDWEGCHTEYAHRKASQLASQVNGRVLLTDLYGSQGKPLDYAHDAHHFIESSLADPAKLRTTLTGIVAAASRLLESPIECLSAVGLCFGGSLAFEIGRAGLGVDAVVSIHGTPSSRLPLRQDRHTTRYLMLHGAADPLIPAQSVNAFMQEMAAAGADWQLTMLGRARHSFTKEEIGLYGAGSRFDPIANRRAFAQAAAFIREPRHDD